MFRREELPFKDRYEKTRPFFPNRPSTTSEPRQLSRWGSRSVFKRLRLALNDQRRSSCKLNYKTKTNCAKIPARRQQRTRPRHHSKTHAIAPTDLPVMRALPFDPSVLAHAMCTKTGPGAAAGATRGERPEEVRRRGREARLGPAPSSAQSVKQTCRTDCRGTSSRSIGLLLLVPTTDTRKSDTGVSLFLLGPIRFIRWRGNTFVAEHGGEMRSACMCAVVCRMDNKKGMCAHFRNNPWEKRRSNQSTPRSG